MMQKDDSEEPDTVVYSEKALSEEIVADKVEEEVFPEAAAEKKSDGKIYTIVSRASMKSSRVTVNS